MFFATYQTPDGETISKLYGDNEHELYYSDTFNPDTRTTAYIDFHAHGNGYIERRESVRNLAIDWTNRGNASDISWMDCCLISDWFYTYGKRYGLLREFRENGLC